MLHCIALHGIAVHRVGFRHTGGYLRAPLTTRNPRFQDTSGYLRRPQTRANFRFKITFLNTNQIPTKRVLVGGICVCIYIYIYVCTCIALYVDLIMLYYPDALRVKPPPRFCKNLRIFETSEGPWGVLQGTFGVQQGPQRSRGGSGASQGGSMGSWEVLELSRRGPFVY